MRPLIRLEQIVYPAFDQRGFRRTIDFDTVNPPPGDNTDIGASRSRYRLRRSLRPSVRLLFQSGGTSIVTVTLTNPNAFDLTGGSFTDTLVNMSVGSAGPAGGTCVARVGTH